MVDYLGRKEKHFFGSDDLWSQGLGAYAAMFSSCPAGTHTLDSTPAYIRSAEVPVRLRLAYPAAELRRKKFILVLREPVSRDFSW